MNVLDEARITALIDAARSARERAYAPYSGYPVGAALLCADDQIVTGCNVENASYGGTICAERTAIVKAVSEGRTVFRAVAVVTLNGGAPCGICRQVLNEFAPDLLVYLADASGALLRTYRLPELLPEAFGPDKLEK